jgi:hypothetical protein
MNNLSPEDCRKCIDLLLDKSAPGNDRVAASDSLMDCNTQEAKAALFQVVIDENEVDYMREEAAGTLGTLWAESEIDYEWIVQIPPPFLDEVVFDFDSYGIKLDKEKLGDKRGLFEARYKSKSFLV